MKAPFTHPDPSEMTIPGMLLRRAAEAPGAPLLRCGDARRNGQEMADAVSLAGAVLQAHGVKPGDRVALMSANRIELLDFILGCAWIGAMAVPINTAARGEQLHHILANSEAKLLLIESSFLEHVGRLRVLPALHKVWVFDGPEGDAGVPYRVEQLPTANAGVEPAAVLPGDTAAILYTSGTTGVSKGVQCPHAQFFWWGLNVTRQLEITAEDVLYTCLPLFHTNAVNAFT
ncbi:MAG: AMP-binding protein, partial [Sinomonas sp.]|nr:AMP-binding protein [Sinomonas sp.]